MPRAFVAFGGNVGDARDTIARGIAQFCDGDRVRLIARSSDYKTPPWGKTDQPAFINACIAIDTALTPLGLLDRAHEVERAFGRDRHKEERWGPRPLDIDLITYGDETLDDPKLTLPHPRMFERAFVLVPLSEIAPDAVIAGRSLREVLERLDRGGIERLA
ncbi:2-amino-4-hydroxy-6-hydroxymethyldihydropteridine diphosphokinase [Pseudorhodoplanes sinuspersici]|uniref:2-amino-4-hydroxy-6-hydroxymethyldihydropteridine pyrophosphokinase n=1 Tax=Pseudorhodoplanes sinuspersici TaxID=1235591 RepID=A0A1W6ZUD3_9HYPH|nr:2-amino-4-hydroxy-6-hydroxymethyldihydropteridine diphosphokinase [Pseudorhodoplanes sinuspersici]ARQ00898.1 2-amino-4-hydroxy-6-hydroxymethyldihydropteridine diphosphokinase [Pseudorhodoplanes sinuspersici]RKE72522.1 2-amino-4-hydroxy-6-hydroxymethyldihydropteridine diphosphokinase [Pseudorhodoplanes sinuspersici]